MKLAIVIKTFDRSPKRNYRRETLANLDRSGIWQSRAPWRLAIVNGQESPTFIQGQLTDHFRADPGAVAIHESGGQHFTPNGNAARSWLIAHQLATTVCADWCLVLEDDIDVCADFLDVTAEWLATYQTRDRHVYPLGCRLEKEMRTAREQGLDACDYRRDLFWGAQAVALRPADALSLATYLTAHPQWCGTTQSHDYLINDWAKERWPEVHHYLTPVPSLVQHIGRESTLAYPGRLEFFEFPYWRGRE